MIDQAIAGDAASGSARVQAARQNCHGEDGKTILPGAANLSGRQKEYLVEQLRAFRSGSRRNESMNIIAQSRTDDDIENLAQWYSGSKISLEVPK